VQNFCVTQSNDIKNNISRVYVNAHVALTIFAPAAKQAAMRIALGTQRTVAFVSRFALLKAGGCSGRALLRAIEKRTAEPDEMPHTNAMLSAVIMTAL
jgi:hypothetical protein